MRDIDLIVGSRYAESDYTFPDIIDGFIKEHGLKEYNPTDFFKVGVAYGMSVVYYNCSNYTKGFSSDGVSILWDEIIEMFIPKDAQYGIFYTFWSSLFDNSDMGLDGFNMLVSLISKLQNKEIERKFTSSGMFFNEIAHYMLIPYWDEIGTELANIVYNTDGYTEFDWRDVTKEQMKFFVNYLEQLPIIVQNDRDKGKQYFVKEIDEMSIDGKLVDLTHCILLDYLDIYCTMYNVE